MFKLGISLTSVILTFDNQEKTPLKTYKQSLYYLTLVLFATLRVSLV